ncbi:GIY-YIG catalytic domain-containing endonuclease [Paramecium bursaria Chlorella virus Fr5L]|nr:GIY-YIG catalytic domain-containing endonuclease [Paramecium bursaria Chlorella virus Fr5L]
MGFIYMLTFPSEKSYIGQTIRDIHKRLEEHQQLSSGCRAISAAIKKYGWENVKIDWYEVPDEDLNKHEELMVEVLGTLAPDGYNLMEGGGAHGKPSQETKKKISEALSGEKNPNYGRTGEKAYWYGKEHIEETKKKIKEANSGEKNTMSKKVYQYTLDDMYVDEFASSGEAAQALEKTDGTMIRKCARGKRPSAYGFKWSREKL